MTTHTLTPEVDTPDVEHPQWCAALSRGADYTDYDSTHRSAPYHADALDLLPTSISIGIIERYPEDGEPKPVPMAQLILVEHEARDPLPTCLALMTLAELQRLETAVRRVRQDLEFIIGKAE